MEEKKNRRRRGVGVGWGWGRAYTKDEGGVGGRKRGEGWRKMVRKVG